MANSITSLKKISQGDWLSFFESHSETDRILRADPSGHYPLMNFETRVRTFLDFFDAKKFMNFFANAGSLQTRSGGVRFVHFST